LDLEARDLLLVLEDLQVTIQFSALSPLLEVVGADRIQPLHQQLLTMVAMEAPVVGAVLLMGRILVEQEDLETHLLRPPHKVMMADLAHFLLPMAWAVAVVVVVQ